MKFFYIYKAIRKVFHNIVAVSDKIRTLFIFWGNNVRHHNFNSIGIPYVSIAVGGKCSIGRHFTMNNAVRGNPIGCYQRCTLFVDNGADLIIGNNVGISQTALICHKKIEIGNHVLIGGGVCIYDTDFHSLDPVLRSSDSTDAAHKSMKEVIIGDNVFIGAFSIILKGVTIGKNSVIGAGSVVTKSIPPNQIWAGNPAKFIKNIDFQ
jgi:acetyltransferase-like isoleucine patch superfamily enzyme